MSSSGVRLLHKSECVLVLTVDIFHQQKHSEGSFNFSSTHFNKLHNGIAVKDINFNVNQCIIQMMGVMMLKPESLQAKTKLTLFSSIYP